MAADAGFHAALAGRPQVRTLGARNDSATVLEQPLLRRYGDMLVLKSGVRLTPGGPILAVVVAYAALAPTQHQADVDTRSIVWVLAFGLLLFWVALFQLIVRASRRLTRQTKANTYLATHDALTGLPNRELLRDRSRRRSRAGAAVPMWR